jgi:pimeloyl-ACP methyl ester carboxylesterase
MKPALRRFVPLLSLLAFLGFGYYAATRVFPLEISQLSHRWEFYRNGVHQLDLPVVGADGAGQAMLRAYERNFCSQESKPASKECTCLVLLHGSGDQAMTWRKILVEPSLSWAKPVRLLAIDVPGAGDSWSPANAEDHAARRLSDIIMQSILAQVPRSECRAWMVVGNSYGGWLAAWAAIDHRDRVNKLVLVDAAGLASQKDSTADVKKLFDGSVEGLREFQRRAYHQPRELPGYAWEAATARLRQARNALPPGADVVMENQERLDTYLASIRANTLVFWGKSDRITPPAGGREFARLVPGAQLREAPDCGHLPQKECPAALMKALNEWVVYGAM